MWPASPCSALIWPTFWAQRARALSRRSSSPSIPSISARTPARACCKSFCRGSLMGSPVTFGEIVHEGHQRLYRFQRDGVVDRGTHAADRLVALQRGQAGGLGFGQEGGVELGIGQHEGNVHRRAAVWVDRVTVETLRTVDRS